ncbi:MAG: prolipoprotein diacylglyceryl transferase family protein [Polyangiaceae bacterium]
MKNKIRFGLSSTRHPDVITHLGPFCEAMGRVLDADVESYLAPDYDGLLRQVDAGDVDLAWLPPIPALRRASEDRFAFLALPVRNGVASYSTVLFTRRGSSFSSSAELRGARMAWVDRDSAAGHLVLRSRLVADGIDPSKICASETFMGSHDGVIRAVLKGEADAGATYAHVTPTGEVASAGWTGICADDDVQILLIEGPIPADVLGATSGLNADLAQSLQSALLDATEPSLHERAKRLFHAESFERPDADHFLLVARLRARLQSADPDAGWELPFAFSPRPMRPFVIELLAQWLGDSAEFLVPGYLFCLGLGTLVAAVWVVDATARIGYPNSKTLTVLLMAYGCGIAGATLVPVVQVLDTLIREHRLVVRSGLAAYGGLLGGAAGAAWSLRRQQLEVWPFLDEAAPALGLGYFFARIGCFLAGCDYGKVTSSPLAVRFPPESFAYNDHVNHDWITPLADASLPVHPTQLYLSFTGLLLFFVIRAVPSKHDGRRFVLYFVAYGVLRSIIELFRGDSARGSIGPLSTSQFLALVSSIVLVALWAKGVIASRSSIEKASS